MKQLFIFVFAVSFLGCKNSSKNSIETADTEIISGNYIFFEDAAVLQNEVKIYGVILNDLVKELNKTVQSKTFALVKFYSMIQSLDMMPTNYSR